MLPLQTWTRQINSDLLNPLWVVALWIGRYGACWRSGALNAVFVETKPIVRCIDGRSNAKFKTCGANLVAFRKWRDELIAVVGLGFGQVGRFDSGRYSAQPETGLSYSLTVGYLRRRKKGVICYGLVSKGWRAFCCSLDLLLHYSGYFLMMQQSRCYAGILRTSLSRDVSFDRAVDQNYYPSCTLDSTVFYTRACLTERFSVLLENLDLMYHTLRSPRLIFRPSQRLAFFIRIPQATTSF